MLDIRWMRENREALAEAMVKLNDTTAPWEQALDLDERRRQILVELEGLRAERNTGSKEIGLLFREKKTAEANALKAHMGADRRYDHGARGRPAPGGCGLRVRHVAHPQHSRRQCARGLGRERQCGALRVGRKANL